ncbi:hypothetical protein ACIRPQ_29475 [Streptomyces sp. NPDC101213]|uniref:hypothetical protein n=1 Tax=Streptomyces sp. NPDC101213 TaxID=3366130 RepID=UPI00382E3D85
MTASTGQGFTANEADVRYVHTSPGGSTVPYNTSAEAQGAVDLEGGSWVKMDTANGRVLSD